MSLPISPNATVTIAYNDFRAIEREVAELRAKIAAAGPARPVQDLPERMVKLEAVARHAAPIIGFAAGLLNPETYRGWPHRDLDQLATLFAQLFATDPAMADYAATWRTIAREALDVDKFRQQRYEAAAAILAETADTTTVQLSDGQAPTGTTSPDQA